MLNLDKDALLCDLAETYHIYDYKSLPCRMVATFSCGLRENSRIKMKMAGIDPIPEQILMAAIADGTRTTAWLQSEDLSLIHISALKIATARQGFAQTDIFLEMIGFDQADIRRIRAQEQRAKGDAILTEEFGNADNGEGVGGIHNEDVTD